jgi:Spy/CpxP family protein refolding chaperone
MKKSIILSALFVATLLWSFSAQAWWGRGAGGPGAGPCWQGNMYGVNLTQDQTVKMNALQQAFVKDTAELNTRLSRKQLELNSQLLEPAPDAGKIASLQKEISSLQLQLNEKSVAYQLEARKVLTPEQVAQLPAGCALGFGSVMAGSGPGYGCGMGPGYGSGYGRGYGCGRGPGYGRGCWW